MPLGVVSVSRKINKRKMFSVGSNINLFFFTGWNVSRARHWHAWTGYYYMEPPGTPSVDREHHIHK